VTLARLVLAWLPVAAWFMIATLAVARLMTTLLNAPGQPGEGVGWPTAPATVLLKWRLVEAAVLTLFASLWFDSLGSGGWGLVFLLIGVLVAVPEWLVRRPELPRRPALIGVGADLARYAVAGAILAWRLG
jgi:hypothetical protein